MLDGHFLLLSAQGTVFLFEVVHRFDQFVNAVFEFFELLFGNVVEVCFAHALNSRRLGELGQPKSVTKSSLNREWQQGFVTILLCADIISSLVVIYVVKSMSEEFVLSKQAVVVEGVAHNGKPCRIVDNTGKIPRDELQTTLDQLIESKSFGLSGRSLAGGNTISIGAAEYGHIQFGDDLYRMILKPYEALLEGF